MGVIASKNVDRACVGVEIGGVGVNGPTHFPESCLRMDEILDFGVFTLSWASLHQRVSIWCARERHLVASAFMDELTCSRVVYVGAWELYA